MKNKKHVWVAGAMCVLPLMGMAQQTEPLTDSRRLFDDGKELFLRRDYAAAQQTLSRFVQQKPQASLADEAAYMIACTSYELKSPDCIKQLEGYLEQYLANCVGIMARPTRPMHTPHASEITHHVVAMMRDFLISSELRMDRNRTSTCGMPK